MTTPKIVNHSTNLQRLIAPTSVQILSLNEGLLGVKEVCQDTPEDQPDDTLIDLRLGEMRNEYQGLCLKDAYTHKEVNTPRKKLDFSNAV